MESDESKDRVEPDHTNDVEWREAGTTEHEHFLEAAPSDPNSDLWSAQCSCGHGVSFNPHELALEDGKLIPRKEENG